MQDYVRNVERAGAAVRTRRAGAVRASSQAPSGTRPGRATAQNQVNTLPRASPATLVDRARNLDVPGRALDARSTTSSRRSSCAATALAGHRRRSCPTALARRGAAPGATARIAEQMQVFLASDVIYDERFRPELVKRARRSENVSATLPASIATFLPDIEWLAARLRGRRRSPASRLRRRRSATPGLHGNGLGTVSLGGVALTPGGSTTVQLTKDIAFDIQVVNQGENTETDVSVTVTVGSGGDADQARGDDRQRSPPARPKSVEHPARPAAADRPERADQGDRQAGAGRAEDRQQHADYTVIFTR